MHLSDIPIGMFLHHLFSLTPARDILSLGCTSKFFATVCADEAFWKRKCLNDFDKYSSTTIFEINTGPWKQLYTALSFPKLFVWGHLDTGRRGLESWVSDGHDGFPSPVEIELPGVRLVRLDAGSWSFNALDADGSMYVWGTIDGEALQHMPWQIKSPMSAYEVKRPRRLAMPHPILDIGCGREHTTVLDSQSEIWDFSDWFISCRLRSPLLACTAPESTPCQIACGWYFSAILTRSGDVLIFWPSGLGPPSSILVADPDTPQHGTIEEDHIDCIYRQLHVDLCRLPPIPRLPELDDAQGLAEERHTGLYLVKIAATIRQIIGLTNKGHVLKFGSIEDKDMLASASWEYLENYSEPSKIARFVQAADSDLEVPTSPRITDITAHFPGFAAYSTGPESTVLTGTEETHARSRPRVVRGLQNRGVTAVTMGDDHWAALTASGEVLTWGSYMRGALGLGQPLALPIGAPGGYRTKSVLDSARRNRYMVGPPAVAEPAGPVQFNTGGTTDAPRQMFCIALTASGWHTGTLVVSMPREGE
ncbi:RCC1/BLIP-II [Gloeopeniophorella convolvens]|nr:RCC1/BLIP-II [Gloeopeniophorella convolvens]